MRRSLAAARRRGGAAAGSRESAARAHVRAAEALVTEGLERFSLLGYGATGA